MAVGGTRNKANASVKILKVCANKTDSCQVLSSKVPTFEKDSNRLPLFHVDEELASFACSAVRSPATGKRVDIRSFFIFRRTLR